MKAFRAKDEIRTRDPDLGKVVLYQLSYFRMILVLTSSDVAILVKCISQYPLFRLGMQI
jgi:hypothetical protein